jgi:hypothetical protein
MTVRVPAVLCTLAISVVLGEARVTVDQAPPPTAIPQVRFSKGQGVVPYYEGWIRRSDGSFDLVFGYLNRNYEEELAIPVGPNNSVEPGGPDRGQPTYFLSRRQARIFRVRVPNSWAPGSLRNQ